MPLLQRFKADILEFWVCGSIYAHRHVRIRAEYGAFFQNLQNWSVNQYIGHSNAILALECSEC